MNIGRRSIGEIATAIYQIEEESAIHRKQFGEENDYAKLLDERAMALKWVLYSEQVGNIVE